MPILSLALVEGLGRYSNQSCHKIEQMTTIAAALKRKDAGHIKPRPQRTVRKTQRYRLSDRFTPDELAKLVARYQAGEMSTALSREAALPSRPFCAYLRSIASPPGLAV